MKIFFGHCQLDRFFDDSNVKLGIGWCKHHKSHKWFGFTVYFYLVRWLAHVNYVSDWKEYDKKINRFGRK